MCAVPIAESAWKAGTDVISYLSELLQGSETMLVRGSGSDATAASMLAHGHQLCVTVSALSGQHATAIRHSQEAMKLCQAVYGWHDPRTWHAMTQGAEAHERVAQLHVAVMLARRIVSLAEEWRGPFAPITASAQKHLAALLIKNGQSKEAVTVIRSLLSGFCSTCLARTSGTAALHGLLGKALMQQHMWTQVLSCHFHAWN
jgi:hypothetical protein